ncbi:MAG: hypothetical protein L6244_02280 [Candidatus Methanoperedenaceae archaeon]|nr:hypothetical protein [Euryarchaeota archaeon]MCG2727464.1 hypothetical protein [Candidatus Methanoperedenaceae archaeon]
MRNKNAPIAGISIFAAQSCVPSFIRLPTMESSPAGAGLPEAAGGYGGRRVWAVTCAGGVL